MKQTVEEAAYDYATNKTKFRKDVLKEVDADTYVSRHADSMEDFQCGAEWQSKQSPWISVNERLPENEDMVFTLCKVKRSNNYFICVNNYIDGEWEAKALVYYDTVYYDTVAWMPIPSFDDILEANRDVLERIKEKGD
jgi:hypothetical protein